MKLDYNNYNKLRGDSDVSYLGITIDEMITEFMKENSIPGLTLAIVQAPYIPRVVGYGLSDEKQRRLASVNTLWPAGPISQGFTAVAIMQLYEKNKLDIYDELKNFIPEIPSQWSEINVLQLLRHSSGIMDYRDNNQWTYDKMWSFEELLQIIENEELLFEPGTKIDMSATNFLILSEIIERVSGKSFREFILEGQIDYLGLKHTAFKEDFDKFSYENVLLTNNIHEKFKADKLYIDPIEPAVSYSKEHEKIEDNYFSFSLKGFSDIWASAQDISIWDISLAGSVLIKNKENRDLIYSSWNFPDGNEVPAVAGWQFYKHRGFMDIKGSVPGYSSFLSRFTNPEELVCVTLLANKENIDFTNLGRRIASAFGSLLSTKYNDNHLYLYEGQLPVKDTVKRFEEELKKREIPIFSKFDHKQNAGDVGLELRPTTVLVFGSPKVGTLLMQEDQSISLELPLHVSIWEDENGSTWLAFPRMNSLLDNYKPENISIIYSMEKLLEELVQHAGDVYKK